MSGGSMDYLYSKVEDALFSENTPERKAFAKHLKNVARALRAIEWNDSGDGDEKEREKIMACISKGEVIGAALDEARRAQKQLQGMMTKAQELRAMLEATELLAICMRKKLKRQARKGYHGGLDQNNLFQVAKQLRDHVDRLTGHAGVSEPKQAIDVCNLAMMLWVQAGSPE